MSTCIFPFFQKDTFVKTSDKFNDEQNNAVAQIYHREKSPDQEIWITFLV